MKTLQNLLSRTRHALQKAMGYSLALPLAAIAGQQAHAGTVSTSTSATTGGVQTLTTIAQNQDTTASALFSMVANYAMVGGVGLAMMGLLQMAFAHKKQESMKPGAVMLIIGGVLASIIAVLHSGSATIFNSDQTSLSSLGNSTVSTTTGTN